MNQPSYIANDKIEKTAVILSLEDMADLAAIAESSGESSEPWDNVEAELNNNKLNALKTFFKPYQKNLTGFIFDREEANAR